MKSGVRPGIKFKCTVRTADLRFWSVVCGLWSLNSYLDHIDYSRDNMGNVTYKSVWLDGVQQDIDATAPSAFALGWGKALLANFQVDGATSTAGAAIVYLDNFTVYRW